MPLTYDVRLYTIEARPDRPKPYRVRWVVGQRKHSKSYKLKVQADGRRSELMARFAAASSSTRTRGYPPLSCGPYKAQSPGTSTPGPTSTARWAAAPAKSRKNYADALATITPALVKSTAGKPDPALLRRALYGWAYNRNRWEEEPPEDVARALQWMAKNSVPVSALEDAATVRLALDALGLKVDG